MLLKRLYLCLILMIFVPHISGRQARCLLPMRTGPGKAILKRFFYNTATGKCQAFNWGGLGGNANRFNNIVICRRNCL
ncbi:PI-actitoxin-Afv2b [Drosophila subobscura]|uniref:PI-actitoxin-Afv2b n=1 Tax=Drosophila subobscura TaxID=7241 RepID=UPI00155A8415|nr:PI-actitoxin-Afv2b [Drosophila subobscura]